MAKRMTARQRGFNRRVKETIQNDRLITRWEARGIALWFSQQFKLGHIEVEWLDKNPKDPGCLGYAERTTSGQQIIRLYDGGHRVATLLHELAHLCKDGWHHGPNWKRNFLSIVYYWNHYCKHHDYKYFVNLYKSTL